MQTHYHSSKIKCYFLSDKFEIVLDKSFKNNFGTDIKLFPGYAQTVADMNGDFKQDLILVTNRSNKLHFELWTVESDNKFTLQNEYDPPEAYNYGLSLFADFGM